MQHSDTLLIILEEEERRRRPQDSLDQLMQLQVAAPSKQNGRFAEKNYQTHDLHWSSSRADHLALSKVTKQLCASRHEVLVLRSAISQITEKTPAHVKRTHTIAREALKSTTDVDASNREWGKELMSMSKEKADLVRKNRSLRFIGAASALMNQTTREQPEIDLR